MKQSFYLLTLIGSFFTIACNQGTKNSEQADSLTKSEIPEQCYLAVFEKDTASLNIRTATDGIVTGDLVIDFGELKPNSLEKVINKGKVKGSYRGDTLFVNYIYTSGSINQTVYQNPLAFLRRGEKLILGVGDIESAMGRAYFVKDKPINFDIGRFKFEPVDCKR